MKAYRDLACITRDGLSLIIARLIGVVTDKLSKLLDGVKTQVIVLISYWPTITHYIPPVLIMKFKTIQAM